MIKIIFKSFGILTLVMCLFLALGQGLGWFSVFSTKTLGKAKQNAETTVYYETQAFVSGKKQAALNYYKEYQKATDNEKQVLCNLISDEFADFDESKLNYKLQAFISRCKYGN